MLLPEEPPTVQRRLHPLTPQPSSGLLSPLTLRSPGGPDLGQAGHPPTPACPRTWGGYVTSLKILESVPWASWPLRPL